jgi:hypothetical protein
MEKIIIGWCIKMINEKKYLGKKWNELSEVEQKELLSRANAIDGATGNNIDNGECIIDLTENLSIAGRVEYGEITIEDEAIIYNPTN